MYEQGPARRRLTEDPPRCQAWHKCLQSVLRVSKYPSPSFVFSVLVLSAILLVLQLSLTKYVLDRNGRHRNAFLLHGKSNLHCEPDKEARFVFYNRLPKSGSSTILNITRFLRNNGTLHIVGLNDPDHFYHPYGLRPVHDYIYFLEAEVRAARGHPF